MSDLLFIRWREATVHHADLGLGFAWSDWDRRVRAAELARLTMLWASRKPMGLTDLPPEALRAGDHHRVAWLLGRAEIEGLGPAGIIALMRLKQVVVGAARRVWPFSLRPSRRSAHAGLEASVPSANAVLETGPPNIELDFNEAVDFKLADIELYDQTAKLIATGTAERITDDTVVQVSVPTIGNGVYVVVWRVPSADGHVVDGVFSFQVGVALRVRCRRADRQGQRQRCGKFDVGRLDTAARLLALIGLIVLIGGGVLAMQSADSASNRMLLWLAWVFLLVGSLGSFGLYGAKVVAGTPSDAISPSVWGKVVGSHTASVLLVRAVLVLVVGVLLLTFARRASEIWRGRRADTRHRVGDHVFERRPRVRPASGAVVGRPSMPFTSPRYRCGSVAC